VSGAKAAAIHAKTSVASCRSSERPPLHEVRVRWSRRRSWGSSGGMIGLRGASHSARATGGRLRPCSGRRCSPARAPRAASAIANRELISRRRGDGCEGPEHVAHAIEEQLVEVEVACEVTPEPRHGGDAAGASVSDAELARRGHEVNEARTALTRGWVARRRERRRSRRATVKAGVPGRASMASRGWTGRAPRGHADPHAQRISPSSASSSAVEANARVS
jgi:hypothetical protein